MRLVSMDEETGEMNVALTHSEMCAHQTFISYLDHGYTIEDALTITRAKHSITDEFAAWLHS